MSLELDTSRKIIHIDMDAFYASVEVLDNPKLKGLPLVVGGDPNSRAVVCSASYEARKFGVRSAMPCSMAKRLCPQALFIHPHFSRYTDISRQLHNIFSQYTDIIEALSLDEAWLDVTLNHLNETSATRVAQKIKAQIREELGLTCSAGISFNKFLAKIASDEKKPDGLFVIAPAQAHDFLMKMEVRKIPGVGKVTEQKLKALGIEYGAQLYMRSELELQTNFGKTGGYLYRRIRGIDNNPVIVEHETKSVSVETTFDKDLTYGDDLIAELRQLVDDLMRRLDKKGLAGKTITLKIKFFDFKQVTRSVTRQTNFLSATAIFRTAFDKLTQVCLEEFSQRKIRLIGVGISGFEAETAYGPRSLQLDLFPED